MPDLTEIREALAKHKAARALMADTPTQSPMPTEWIGAGIYLGEFQANAPAWLAELCDENERLTARAEKAEAAVDIAASIIDDARHALAPEQPGPRIEPAKRVLWSEDAHKIVTAWADRKRIASCHIPPRPGQQYPLDGE